MPGVWQTDEFLLVSLISIIVYHLNSNENGWMVLSNDITGNKYRENSICPRGEPYGTLLQIIISTGFID